MNDNMTIYYDLPPNEQYIQLFYYIVLLVFGNDILPQTMNEIFICTIFLYIPLPSQSSASVAYNTDGKTVCGATLYYYKGALKYYISMFCHPAPTHHSGFCDSK